MAFDIRHQYVLSRQIAGYGNFSHDVMDCFEKTPRSFFVPSDKVEKAYLEDFIPLSKDRSVMMPLMAAWLLNSLSKVPEKNIMVVAGSTGYGAALLSYYASTVFLLESDDRFSSCAQKGLSTLHIDNVVLCQGGLKEGLIRQGPFEFIVIEGGVEYVPSSLFDQLTPDGLGIFACEFSGLPVGHMTHFWKSENGMIHKMPLFEMPCYPLKEFCYPKKFEF